MQAPFAFDDNGNLVISAKMVEALGLGKLQDRDDTPDAIRFDQISTGAKRRTDAGEVLRAISDELKKGNLHSGVQDSIDAITAEQQARADGGSALASDLSALASRLGCVESALETEQQTRADGDSALASRARSLETRIDAEEADGSDLRSRVGELESKLRGEVDRLESMIQSPRR
ncbi:hypothetical protein [Halomonas elongata]|uniref:hypothetical protein n=1 Tax=Halomonas elongata TaxID=2746 RepID=UPI00186BA841|nr:hypothetical protein [Halomonas elongata]MBW5800055.1 hypothetical protein [Halomonas elongata]